jgi:tetratricopeptide (TPR) repeat protein
MTAAAPQPAARRATWLNLLLPGGGLILVGAVPSGLLVGLVFAACANFALAAALLFPDDFPPAAQLAGIVLAAAAYLYAQARLAQAVRDLRRQAAAALRRRVLAETQELLARGDHARALAALSAIADQAGADFLVAYRLAQALTAAGNTAAARRAWLRVRELDPHGIYKPQVAAHLGHRGAARPE